MFTVKQLLQPESAEDAYRMLVGNPANVVLGGCAFLRMGSAKYNTAIDLSRIGWQTIVEHDDRIEIGAMATFRMLETHPALANLGCGVVPRAVGNVVGVQFRNIVTVGATVFTRYGFSDLITPLLALDAEVELVKGGRMSLADFLDRPMQKDILAKVWLRKEARQAAYQSFRISAADFPILNVAVSCLENRWTIAVGGRPARAALAVQAGAILSSGPRTEATLESAAKAAADELAFEGNMRATGEYRRALCEELVRRAVREVWQCA